MPAVNQIQVNLRGVLQLGKHYVAQPSKDLFIDV
jgi:hypothetical protein